MAQSKIHEIDLLVPALEYLSHHPGGVETTELREHLEALFQPTDVDAELVGGRNMTAFSQIARNAISNQGIGKNLIAQGFASYDAQTKRTTITDTGLDLLRHIGYDV